MGNYGSPDSSAFSLMRDAQTAKTNAIANTIDNLSSITADFITKRKEAAVAQKKVDAQKQIDVTDLMASTGVSWEGKDQGKRVSLFDVNRLGLVELASLASAVKTLQDNNIQRDRINNIVFDEHNGPDTGIASLEVTGEEPTIKLEKTKAQQITLGGYNLAFRPVATVQSGVVPAESGAMRAPSAYQPFVEKKNSSQQPMNTKQHNSPYLSTVSKVSTELGVDPNLASALVLTENASLNPKATSSAGAVGLLQLMPVTAREMGLNVGKGVDERTDPSKSISAGLGYFAKLTKRFGDEKLALAAYNAGPTRVASLLSKTGGTTYEDIEALLPPETRSYVPKVLSKLG